MGETISRTITILFSPTLQSFGYIGGCVRAIPQKRDRVWKNCNNYVLSESVERQSILVSFRLLGSSTKRHIQRNGAFTNAISVSRIAYNSRDDVTVRRVDSDNQIACFCAKGFERVFASPQYDCRYESLIELI
jgi:hypothetical protein